jgi:hypothetical protein
MSSLSDIDRRRPDWGPLLLLFLFAVGFFFPVLFLGRAPAVNSLRKVVPWSAPRAYRGDATIETAPNGDDVYIWKTPEAFADDLNRQFIPWGLYAQQRLRSGSWPLWNPHLACGMPLYANHQVGLTNPLILLSYYLFPGLSAFTAIFFCTFILVGWGMYAYLRVLGLGRGPALIGAATYQFILGYIPTVDTLVIEKALFPFLLYSVERLVRAPTGRGGVWAMLSAALLALVQTSCHAQEAVFISYMLGPYLVLVAGGPDTFPRGRLWLTIGKRVLLAVGIYLCALLLGLIQNLPTLEFYSLSTRAAGFAEQIESITPLEEQLTWVQSLMIGFPRLFGDYLNPNHDLEHYLLNYGYVGIVTLLAAPFAGWIGPNRRQVWFWRIIALVFFISIISNWWYFDILCHLPLFRLSLQKPFSPLFFSVVVLAGHGFAFLIDPKPPGSAANKWMGRVAIVVYGAALGLGALLALAAFRPGQPFTEEHAYVFSQFGIGAGMAGLACLVVSLAWRHANQDRTDHAGRRRATLFATTGLLVVVLLDLWPVKAHFNPFVPREDLYLPTGGTDFLASRLAWEPGDDGPFRFGRSYAKIFPPNTGMIYGIDDFGAYDSNLVGRYGHLLATVDPTLLQGVHFVEAPRYRDVFRADIWNMLGVKYVMAHLGHLGQFEPPERWRHVYMGRAGVGNSGDNVLIVQNLDALPRMHLVDTVHRATEPERALRLTVRLDSRREAVVETDQPIPTESHSTDAESPPPDQQTPPGTLTITDYHPETVTAKVSCTRPCLLCFFDVWFPGWEVLVDGETSRLERVNYAFKGVFLPQGQHQVVFRYRPRSIIWGALGSLLGLALTLALALPFSRLAGVPTRPP